MVEARHEYKTDTTINRNVMTSIQYLLLSLFSAFLLASLSLFFYLDNVCRTNPYNSYHHQASRFSYLYFL